jgi:hypothetical protein
MRPIKENKLILKLFYFFRIFEISFYIYAFIWHSKNKKRIPNKITPKDILELFYLDFLNIQKKDCKIIEITKNKLITRCKNKCPILELSQNLNIDTKKSCRQISEGPCKYFLKKLDKNIYFKRNYNHIRPYKEDCEEVITINNN